MGEQCRGQSSAPVLAIAAREAAHMASSLQRFHAGGWHALIADAKVAWPLGHVKQACRDPDDDGEVRKLMDKVISLVEQGEVSRAAHLLQSSGVAEANDATADVLRSMLSPNPTQMPPDRSWVGRHKAKAAGIKKKVESLQK